jgi:hypothetical protein
MSPHLLWRRPNAVNEFWCKTGSQRVDVSQCDRIRDLGRRLDNFGPLRKPFTVGHGR